jgi:hypothetical protein
MGIHDLHSLQNVIRVIEVMSVRWAGDTFTWGIRKERGRLIDIGVEGLKA